MKKLHKHIYSEEVLEFTKSSHNFCKWIEDSESESDEVRTFIVTSLKYLPAIYSRMIAIPDFDPVFEEGNEKYVTEEDWSRVYQKITLILGTFNEYDDLPGKSEYDRSEVITRTISEDISDIYQDLRDFLEIFRNSPEEIMNDALWECRANFASSWGEKLLRASKAMHSIYISDDVSVPDTLEGTKDKLKKQSDTKDWFITKRQQEFGEEDEIISE